MANFDVTPPPERLADRLQLRTAFSTASGEVTQFLVQLESWLDDDWEEDVRYDHDAVSPGGHDVTEEGLHRDVYRDGKQYRTEDVSPPIPANKGFNDAKEDLRANVERFTKRFEKWHGVTDETDL